MLQQHNDCNSGKLAKSQGQEGKIIKKTEQTIQNVNVLYLP